MNLHQTVQAKTYVNGFGLPRNERNPGPRLENKSQTGKTNSDRLTSVGKEVEYESPSRDKLVYITTCLIGHHVEVQVLDGSVYSGIFHATNAEEDFGIILKMARLVKDGHKNNSDSSSKPPSKTLIVPAKELVQVIAKGVPVTRDALTNELLREKQQELMTDSYISQSRHVEVERELERWVPDDDDSGCPDLENIFDGSWNRGWDQFEVNEALFGVKSTFNEELYTTKLEKGPQMRELEKAALRMAREIEGEDTNDLHLAEERGIQLHESLELDEEARFSSVLRKVDDSGYDEIEDILFDSHNDQTFGGVSNSVGNACTDSSSGKADSGAQFPQRSFSMLSEEDHTLKPDDAWSTLRLKKESSDKIGLSPNATAYSPSHVSSKYQEKTSSANEPESAVSSKIQGIAQSSNSRAWPSSSASSTSDCGGAVSTSSVPRLSPTSSGVSSSSEKSTLNPHAKEFKLNPKATSFNPSHSPLRPASPVSDGSYYYPANIGGMVHMHGMPVNVGIGPSYSVHQPVLFNPQAAPTPQGYFPPNDPQYGQQMMVGHQQQFMYMPTYPTDNPYKGRDF